MSTPTADGWFRVDNALIDDERWAALSGAAAKVYIVLRRRADEHGRCFPSRRSMARDVGLSTDTITRALRELVGARLITATRRRSPSGDPETNLYQILQLTPRSGSRTDAPTSPHGCGEGSRNGAEEVPAPVPTKEDSLEKDPLKKKARRKPAAASVEIPDGLKTDRFAAAWTMWIAHRIELRKPSTPTAQVQALRKLERWGEARAVAAIEHSTSNGWAGLFEENTSGNGKPRPAEKPPTILPFFKK